MKNIKKIMGILTLSITIFLVTNATGCAVEDGTVADISKKRWDYAGINFVLDKEIMSLPSPGKFHPIGSVSIDTLVDSLIQFERNINPKDKDLEELELWIEKVDLSKNTNLNNPNIITRSDMAVVLYNYLSSDGIKMNPISLNKYIDKNKVPEEAKEPMKYLLGGGFINGKSKNTLGPIDNLRRNELSQILFNLSRLLEDTDKGKVTNIDEKGNITTNIYTQSLLNKGFQHGDMVGINIKGNTLRAPFISRNEELNYSDLYVEGIINQDSSNIKIVLNKDNFAKKYNISVGEDISIDLIKKQTYGAQWEKKKLKRVNNRHSYSSDEIFANFRNVSTGNIAKGVYYRSSSPINNELGRAAYGDSLSKKAGIKTVINLADNEEMMKGHLNKRGFNSPYYKNLYNNGQVILLKMKLDYTAKEFDTKLKSGLEFMIANEGPYLIHCKEGQDRTGFVSALLEGLMGSTVEEIKEDYMKTYINFYNVEYGSEQYNIIAEGFLLEMLRYIGKVDYDEYLEEVDLVKASENYLLKIGLSPEQIEKLKLRLSTEI